MALQKAKPKRPERIIKQPTQLARMERPKSKQVSVTALRNRADKLAGEFCRSLGRCEAQGFLGSDGKAIECSNRLEWAHIKSRAYHFLRHNPRNCVCLCNAHHRHFTEAPDLFYEFIRDVKPGTWDYLNGLIIERRQTLKKMPLRDTYQESIAFYSNLRLDLDGADLGAKDR